jgi:hypothetical protein
MSRSSKHSVLRHQIIDFLREEGPATRAQIAEKLKVDVALVSNLLQEMVRSQPSAPPVECLFRGRYSKWNVPCRRPVTRGPFSALESWMSSCVAGVNAMAQST